jgi:peptidoglycan/LPS O-acetylase OafA/YrhL
LKFLYYRPEVNGLRGIAVLGAVFYHAEIILGNFRIFPGGFLGVDVFIVISGYLMTAIISKEYRATNTFSFKNYYKRRIRRLLPALLVVIFFTSIASYFILLPSLFEDFIKSVLASIFFFSNFFFHYSGQAYGAQVLSEIPLLHTWSLSLEEQFYIVYPTILLGLVIYLKKRIEIILIIGILLSVIFASIITVNHQSFNYYMLPSRAWEFLFGALLGVKLDQINSNENKKTKQFLALIGFIVLLLSFALFDDSNFHPSYLTLIPVTATYLIIQNTSEDSLINKVLSIPALIFIGLISYSFYLWHHPIFSFAKILDIGQESILIKTLIIFISILLGFITYKFIEKPFRNEGEKVFNLGKISSLGLCIVIIIITLNFSINFQKNNHPKIAQELFKKTWFTTKQYFKPCFQRKTFFCSFNEDQKNPTVFLVGDSMMASIQEDLKTNLVKRDINFIPMTNAGCDFLEIDDGVTCNKKILNNRLKKIDEKLGSTIIFHLNYIQAKVDDIFFKESFLEKIYFYLNKDYNIILIYPIPHMDKNVSIEIEKNLLNKKNKIDFVNIDFQRYSQESEKIFTLFDALNHKNLYKVYPHTKLCNTHLIGKCVGNTQNEIYYVDKLHLSNEGSKLINVDLIKIIDKIY